MSMAIIASTAMKDGVASTATEIIRYVMLTIPMHPRASMVAPATQWVLVPRRASMSTCAIVPRGHMMGSSMRVNSASMSRRKIATRRCFVRMAASVRVWWTLTGKYWRLKASSVMKHLLWERLHYVFTFLLPIL